MRVLVTGGAGFIGSHVVDALVQAGHTVWDLDDLSTGKREHVHPQARFIRMDVRSSDIRDVLAEGTFDCVCHLAAQIDVRRSVSDPTYDAHLNIVGSLNLLEAVRTQKVPAVIFSSTGGAIYGIQRRYPAPEDHPTAPLSPYGVAKLTVEHYLEYYRMVHGLRYVVLRYANVFGPRQDPSGEAGVVAIFCDRVLRRQVLTIYGDGEQTRDYVHVRDVAQANRLALDWLAEQRSPHGSEQKTLPPDGSPIFNIGTGIETSVNALASMLADLASVDRRFLHEPARTGEQLRSVIDPAKAQRVLRWEPKTSLQEGLRHTLAWFRERRTLGPIATPPSPGPES